MFLPATDPSCATDVRQAARAVACSLGMDPALRERTAIVATELVTNVVKHGGGGEVVVQSYADAQGSGVEVLALDKGPGIADISRAMVDGYSTAGSAGSGLGAIKRLSTLLEIYSRRGLGTAALARIASEPVKPTAAGFLACCLARPMHRGEPCGDAGAWVGEDGAASVCLVDGLGHGSEAAKAADRAIQIFRSHGNSAADAAVAAIHAGLRATRGAALAVARMDIASGRVWLSGLGNITGALIDAGSTHKMATGNGIAGHSTGTTIRCVEYSFNSAPLLLLHSDGLVSRWNLGKYPGLSEAHPALVAGVLMRDFPRGRDDASAIALRWRAS